MIRSVFLITIFLNVAVYGQYTTNSTNPFEKQDSLALMGRQNSLRMIADTLSLFINDETSGWRQMKLVKYFYDTSNALKSVSYRNGSDGYCYFFFEGAYLEKIVIRNKNGLVSKPYYFTAEEKEYSDDEIEQRIETNPANKQALQLLKMSKDFLKRFTLLLQ